MNFVFAYLCRSIRQMYINTSEATYFDLQVYRQTKIILPAEQVYMPLRLMIKRYQKRFYRVLFYHNNCISEHIVAICL